MEQPIPEDFPKEMEIMESTSSTLEPDGNSTVETSLEKIKAGFPTLPIKTIVLILGGICALGLILFLARKHKENREARLREMQQQQEQRRSGTAAAILRQKGIIGGY